MMMTKSKSSKNHTCIICGKDYHSCDSCNQITSFTPWRVICDTSEHYQIYLVILDYQQNRINKEEAQMMLHNIGFDVNTIDNFKPSVSNLLKEILSEDNSEPEIGDGM